MRLTNLMNTDTVMLDDEHSAVVIIDQTRLPKELVLVSLTTAQQIWDAIYRLQVRGAPAIGVAAAMGIYVLAKSMSRESVDAFCREFCEQKKFLDSARPTAVNLSWALRRMEQVVLAKAAEQKQEGERLGASEQVAEIIEALHREAVAIRNEDIEVCRRIGINGLSLIQPGAGILTHCNAGKLATVRYGTATAPIYLGQEKGYGLRVFCDETRPLLQGARLTACELQASGVDTTLICDNMSAMVMKKGWIDAVFVGCDRVAANGDVANKIGTSVVAAVAKQYGIPLYVCAPVSTIDMDCACGDEIVIEERRPEEVTTMWYAHPMTSPGVKVFNPAFDVTDHELIAGIVTECGVAGAPYDASLRELVDRKYKEEWNHE